MRLDVVRYVLKTSPFSILTDVREYGDVKRRLRIAQDNAENAARGLVKDMGRADENYARLHTGCMVKSICTKYDPAINMDVPYFYSHNCDSFNFSRPCDKTDCLFYKRNQAHFDARKQLENLTHIKNNFWKQKFLFVR